MSRTTLAFALALTACGMSTPQPPAMDGSAPPDGAFAIDLPAPADFVNGTIQGTTLSVLDAAFAPFLDMPNLAGPFTLVGLSAVKQETCYSVMFDRPLANGNALELELGKIASPGHTALIDAPGDYAVGYTGNEPAGTKVAYVDWLPATASCSWPTVNNPLSATSGTVTVTSVSASNIAGYFDVTMSSGDHLTGAFFANACGIVAMNTPGACP